MENLEFLTTQNSNNLNHSEAKVNELWSILKDVKCDDGKIGKILPTYFDENMFLDFERDYYDAIKSKNNSIPSHIHPLVITNIEYALKYLRGSEIYSHHLSCQRPKVTNRNSVLSIDFKRNDEHYTIGIPGISYVFDI